MDHKISICHNSWLQSSLYLINYILRFIKGINKLSQINLLFHGIIVGIIIFQTSIIAPTVFKTINPKETSSFLRIIFPKFFILILALGLMSLIAELFYEKNTLTISISALTVLMAMLCYLIIPSTNSATDEGDKKKFKQLHSLSVITTIGILLLNISTFFVTF